MRFGVTSPASVVQASIQRMVLAHVATKFGTNIWTMTGAQTTDGATLDVAGTAAAAPIIQGLGFMGVRVLGSHNQAHHLGLNTGASPHD